MRGGLRIACVALLGIVLAAAPAEASRRVSIVSLESPATAKPAESIQVAGAVGNRGNRRAGTTVRVRLDGAPTPLGAQRIRVSTSHARPFSISVTLPGDLGPGPHSLAACVRRHGRRGTDRCTRAPLEIEGPGSSGPPEPPPAFTPGARTRGDPILPQLGNGGYDALHYALAMDYDRAANEFNTATVVMTARATQSLSEFSLDFQDLPVDEVKVDGEPATFTQVDAEPPISGDGTQPMKLVVTPAAGILDGTEFELAVRYHGAPQVFTDPDGTIEGWIPRPGCVPPVSCTHFVVGEPMGSQAWFPSNDHPSDKATYETKITVPEGEVAVGVGELESQTTAARATTWTWTEDDPTASYLVTASNGTYELLTGSATEGQTGRSLPVYDAISDLALPPQRDGITALTDRNAEMIDALGAHYGPYPFDSYGSLWDSLPNVGYALEVQTKSHFSSLSAGAGTYLHELSHMWWGDAVTLQNWNDIWFNEGFAQFSEWLFGFESGADPQSPRDHFDDEYASASSDDWSVAPAVLNNDPALLFSSFPTYTRGGMTVTGYREIIGHAAFDDFCRALQTELAFSSISTPDFIARAETASGFTGPRLELLHEYFQQWLYGTTKPTITPDDF